MSCEYIRLATTEATHSRVYSLRKFKTLNGRPSCVRSATISYVHTWLSPSVRLRTQEPLASHRPPVSAAFAVFGGLLATRSYTRDLCPYPSRSVTVLCRTARTPSRVR